MFPVSDHFWQCDDCHHEFSTCQKGLPLSLQTILQCPECSSQKIRGGLIVHGGPFDDESNIHF